MFCYKLDIISDVLMWLAVVVLLWCELSVCASDVGGMARNYTVEPVRKEDRAEVLELLRRTFYFDEPLNKAVGLCDKDADKCEDLDLYCNETMLEDLSLKAVDPQGKVVGAMLNGLYTNMEGHNEKELQEKLLHCKDPRFAKILQIIIRREQARLWQKFPSDKQILEIKVAATDKNWRRKGIMNALLEATEKLARDRQLRLLRMDSSSAYSAMAAEKRGFTSVYKVSYSDVKQDNETIIVPEPPHLYDSVYVKQLFQLTNFYEYHEVLFHE